MTTNDLVALAIVFAACFVNGLVFAGATWAIASLVGARVVRVALGAGPGLERVVGDVNVRLAVFPFPASVELAGAADDDPYDAPDAFRKLDFVQRMSIRFFPLLAMTLLASLLLGPSHALRSLVHTYPQIVSSLTLVPLFEDFIALAHREPLHAFASVHVKMVALSLLPIRGTPSGAIASEIARSLRPPEKLRAEAEPGILLKLSVTVFVFGITLRLFYGFVVALVS